MQAVAKDNFEKSGASFTKLTCIFEISFGNFSYEIHTILLSNPIVSTFECQA
jgi:hypothetical protein